MMEFLGLALVAVILFTLVWAIVFALGQLCDYDDGFEDWGD